MALGQLLGKLTGADFQSGSDQPITIASGGASYIPVYIVFTNASASLDTSAGGMFSEVDGGGEMIMSDGNTFEGLGADPRNTVVLGPNYSWYTYSAETWYFHLTALNEVPATADIYIYGLLLA